MKKKYVMGENLYIVPQLLAGLVSFRLWPSRKGLDDYAFEKAFAQDQIWQVDVSLFEKIKYDREDFKTVIYLKKYLEKIDKIIKEDNYQNILRSEISERQIIYENPEMLKLSAVNFYLDVEYLHFNMMGVFFGCFLRNIYGGKTGIYTEYVGFKDFFLKLIHLFDYSFIEGTFSYSFSSDFDKNFGNKYASGCLFKMLDYKGKFYLNYIINDEKMVAQLKAYLCEEPVEEEIGNYKSLYPLMLELTKELKDLLLTTICVTEDHEDTWKLGYGITTKEFIDMYDNCLNIDGNILKGIRKYFEWCKNQRSLEIITSNSYGYYMSNLTRSYMAVIRYFFQRNVFAADKLALVQEKWGDLTEIEKVELVNSNFKEFLIDVIGLDHKFDDMSIEASYLDDVLVSSFFEYRYDEKAIEKFIEELYILDIKKQNLLNKKDWIYIFDIYLIEEFESLERLENYFNIQLYKRFFREFNRVCISLVQKKIVKIENLSAFEVEVTKQWMEEVPRYFLKKMVYYPLIKKYFEEK